MSKSKKSKLLSGLTVAGFLAASVAAPSGVFANPKNADGDDKPKTEETTKDKDMKKGSCSGAGGCGAMKDEKKDEKKEEKKKGSCSGAGGCGATKDDKKDK